MENYAGAHESRLSDVDALLASPNQRATAAAHLGGVAVECRLKALVVRYHKIAAWDEPSGRTKDPQYKQPISRPGHGLISAIKIMSDLYKKALADRLFLGHLDRVMHPTGATMVDFIELRYSADDLDRATMADWRRSLDYVLGWLKKNEVVLP
jgi:hypothetical protein